MRGQFYIKGPDGRTDAIRLVPVSRRRIRKRAHLLRFTCRRCGRRTERADFFDFLCATCQGGPDSARAARIQLYTERAALELPLFD